MPTSDLDVSRVLPYLKAAETGSSAEPAGDQVAAVPVTRPFVGQLLTTYVIDQGGHFQYITEEQLSTTGHRIDELHEYALRNLARRTAEHELRLARHQAIVPVLFDGNFEASMMQLDPFWAEVQDQLGQQELLAVAPARDILAVCPADSAEGRAELGELIDRIWPGGDHLLTRDVYRRVDGAWAIDRT